MKECDTSVAECLVFFRSPALVAEENRSLTVDPLLDVDVSLSVCLEGPSENFPVMTPASEESCILGVVGKTVNLEEELSSRTEVVSIFLVVITDGGVDEIGIEGLGSSLVPIDGPSELPDFFDSFSLDPSSVDVASPLSLDDSLLLSDELSVASSDLVVFEEDLVVED